MLLAKHCVSELSPEDQQVYFDLLRDGSPVAMSQAITMMGGKAVSDKQDFQDCLRLLASKPSDHPPRRVDPAQVAAQVAELDEQIAALVRKRESLQFSLGNEVRQQNELGKWKLKMKLLVANPSIRYGLADELIAAGVEMH